MSEIPVNLRAQQILKLLVERYIQDGNPVGSRTIAEESTLGLSPATIRNILADLEEAGFLASPHTSAGRIPTPLGYRFFVDSLLTITPFETQAVQDLRSQLDPDMTIPHLLQSASSALSGLTHMTGVVSLPRRNRVELRQVEFLPLSSNRVLVILVLNNREVQNRVIYTNRVYTPSELQAAANYLNAHFVGKDLLAIRQELLNDLQHDKETMNHMLQTAMEMGNKAFVTEEPEPQKDYIMAGQDNLLGYNHDIERLYDLFKVFSEKQEILNLLSHSLEAEGIQIYIGKESGCDVFDNCSIVTTSYAVDGQLIGSLGVIGPTRMPYDRVISAVDVTAKLLSAALNQR